MKKNVLLLTIIILFGFTTTSFSADVAKIGVVSYQIILNKSAGGQIMKEKILAKKNKLEQTFSKKKDEIDKEQKKLQKDSFLLAPEKLKARTRELRIKINDFKELQKDSTIQLKALEDELLKQFQAEISKIVKELGKKEGYLLILNKNTADIAYAPDHIDITDKVLKKYNSLISSKK